MYRTWRNKTDPQQHPVRFLAALWQQRLKDNPRISGRAFTPKQYGQLKQLKDAVGDLAQPMVEWILKPENWWMFAQRVRTEIAISYQVPDDPAIGFLLLHRNRALRIMRNELRSSTQAEDIEFCAVVDQRLKQQLKSLLLIYADGNQARIATIEAANSVEEMERLFMGIPDNS